MSARKAPIVIKKSGNVNGDINITPLVDVVLVLLIIFMVVTPLLEKDLPIQVPSTENVDQPDDLPNDQLLVNVTAAGDYQLNNTMMTGKEDLTAKLKAKLETRTDANKMVFIMSDDAADYGKVIGALDASKAAGAKLLGMATEDPTPPGGAAPP